MLDNIARLPAKVKVVSAVIAACLVVMVIALTRPNDEDKIRGQLARLAKAVKVTGEPSNPIVRLSYLNGEFAEIFDQNVRVSIPELTSLRGGRKELAGACVHASNYFNSASVDFNQIEIKLDDSKRTAHVGTTASLTAQDRNGQRRDDQRGTDFLFFKGDSGWMITSVTVWPAGGR